MQFETRIFKTSEVLISSGIVNRLLRRSSKYDNLSEEHSKGIHIRRLYTPFMHSSRFKFCFYCMAYMGADIFNFKTAPNLNIHSASLYHLLVYENIK